MKIILPKGFVMPENARPGEPFEVVAVIRPGEEGSFELASIDGMELEGEEAEVAEDEEAMSEEQRFAAKMEPQLPWNQPDPAY